MGSSLMGDGTFDASHILKIVCVRSRVSATDQIKISKSENYHTRLAATTIQAYTEIFSAYQLH